MRALGQLSSESRPKGLGTHNKEGKSLRFKYRDSLLHYN